MRRRICLSAITVFLLTATAALADTIVQNAGGISGNNVGFYGQSLITPAGAPWNNITFNFLAAGNAPQAAGALYLLSTEYLGTPAGLSSSTAGFIAQSLFVGEGTGAWMFAPGVTLLPSTTYFLYSNFNF